MIQETITKKVDSAAKIPKDYLRVDPPCPKSVKIELTGKCNYRCAFCALGTRDAQPKHDMDWHLFARITKEMKDAGVQEIGLFYIGEPFFNPGLLIRAIHYLKDELGMPYVFLTSNASLADPDYVEQCMAAGLDSLKWSCNAADEKQFIELMQVGSSAFYRARLNIMEAWRIRNSKGYKTRLYASSIRYDDKQHDRMETMLKAHVLSYVDEHYWLPLYSMGDLASAEEGKVGLKPTAGNRGRYDNPVDPLPCWSCFTVGHVLNDGRLSACCFDAGGYWIMGDLKTQTFMDAWNSLDFQDLRKAHLLRDVTGTKCESCVTLNR